MVFLQSPLQSPGIPLLEYRGGNMSISLSAYIDPSKSGGYLVSKAWNGNGQYNYCLQLDTSNKLIFSVGGNSEVDPPVSITSSSSLPAGQWYDILAVLTDSKTMSLYVNGIQVATGDFHIRNWNPVHGDSHEPLALGTWFPYGPGWSGNTSYSFQGMLENVQIYRRVLTPTQVSHQSNPPLDHRRYDSFGKLRSESDANVNFPFGYAGRPLDPTTGLYNDQNRWYDPTQGRFLSADPSGFAAGDANLFRYVGNNPLGNSDPTGLCSQSNNSNTWSGFGGANWLVNSGSYGGLGASHTPSMQSPTNQNLLSSLDEGVAASYNPSAPAQQPTVAESAPAANETASSAPSAAPAANTQPGSVTGAWLSGFGASLGTGLTNVGKTLVEPFLMIADVPHLAYDSLAGYDLNEVQPWSMWGQYSQQRELQGASASQVLAEGTPPLVANVGTAGWYGYVMGAYEYYSTGNPTAWQTASPGPLMGALALKGALSESAPVETGPIVGGGANLENLTPAAQARIQAWVDSHGTNATVVGSRAGGTSGPLSDFDYLIGGNSKLRASARWQLPSGPAGGAVGPNGETGIDIFNENVVPLDPTRPHIIFRPTPGKGG